MPSGSALGNVAIVTAVALAAAACTSPRLQSPSAPAVESSAAPAPTTVKPTRSASTAGFAPTALGFWDAEHGLVVGTVGRQQALALIKVTADGGLTWTDLPVRPVGTPTAVSTLAPGTAWVSLECQDAAPGCSPLVMVTQDRGQSWSNLPGGIASLSFIDMEHGWAVGPPWGSPYVGPSLPAIPPQAVAPTPVVTDDGGAHWRAGPRVCQELVFEALAVHFADARHGWVACGGIPGAGEQPKAVYATEDGGATWELRSRALPDGTQDRGDISIEGYPRGIWVDATGRGWLWGDRMVINATRDGGTTWQLLPLGDPDVNTITDASPLDARVGFALLWEADRQATSLQVTTVGGQTWSERFLSQL